MVLRPNPLHFDDSLVNSFLDRLRDIFTAMDLEYARAASHYQFHCDGCKNSCCLTRFYHHTYLEYFYFRRSFEKLDSRKKDEIIAKAEEVCRATAKADEKDMPVRLMCPLNDDSLCTLYPFRPMICRMHGIPHELQKPGQNVIHGSGCSTFDERCADKGYFKFDRTPIYVALANLENEFKQTVGIEGKIKMTVAEMILGITQEKKD